MPQVEARQAVKNGVPGAAVDRRRPPKPQQVSAQLFAQSTLERGEQVTAQPGTQVPRVFVGRVVVEIESPLVRMS